MNQEKGTTSQEQKSTSTDSVQNHKWQKMIEIFKRFDDDFALPEKLTFRTEIREIKNKIQIQCSSPELEVVEYNWKSVQLDLQHNVPFQALVTSLNPIIDGAQVVPLNVLDQLYDYMTTMKEYYSKNHSLLSDIVTKANCKVGDLIIAQINDLFYRVELLQVTPQFKFRLIDFGFTLVFDYDNTYLDNLYPPCLPETLQSAFRGFKMNRTGDIARFSVLWIEFVKDPPILTKDLLMRQEMTTGTEKELLIMDVSDLEENKISIIEYNSEIRTFYDKLQRRSQEIYEENLKNNTIGHFPKVQELIWTPLYDLPFYARGICESVDGGFATVYCVDSDCVMKMVPTSMIIKMKHPVMFSFCIQKSIVSGLDKLIANNSKEEIQILKEKLSRKIVVAEKIELDETGLNYKIHIPPERFQELLK